ncbi:MAG: hypothetical protein ACLP9L_29790 [Thermoguttaceae bacterium]
MNRQLPLLVVAGLLIGKCGFADAAEPNADDPQPVNAPAVETAQPNSSNSTQPVVVTAAAAAERNTNSPHNQFAGKIVRVQMKGATRNEVFMLENVRMTTLFGREAFLVGTGIQDSPHQTSWCEGLEVHLNLHSVLSYMSMTPEQWKAKQQSAPRFGPSQSDRPEPSAGSLEGRIPPVPPTAPTGIIPSLPQPAAGPPLVPPQPTVPYGITPAPSAVPIPAPPTPQAAPSPVLPTQPNNPTAPPAAGSAPSIDDQLKAAQDERVTLLSQIVEILTSQYKVGSADIAQVAAAENELCNALLDSTDEPERRTDLLAKQFDKANDFAKLMKVRFDAAGVSAVDLDRAKLLCLDVRIRLLREGIRKRPLTIIPAAKQP